MISYSNTGNETLDQSINEISNFAQRVHNSIQSNFDQHRNIYEQLTYIESAREDIDVISEVTASSLTNIDTRLKKIEEILAYYK